MTQVYRTLEECRGAKKGADRNRIYAVQQDDSTAYCWAPDPVRAAGIVAMETFGVSSVPAEPKILTAAQREEVSDLAGLTGPELQALKVLLTLR